MPRARLSGFRPVYASTFANEELGCVEPQIRPDGRCRRLADLLPNARFDARDAERRFGLFQDFDDGVANATRRLFIGRPHSPRLDVWTSSVNQVHQPQSANLVAVAARVEDHHAMRARRHRRRIVHRRCTTNAPRQRTRTGSSRTRTPDVALRPQLEKKPFYATFAFLVTPQHALHHGYRYLTSVTDQQLLLRKQHVSGGYFFMRRLYLRTEAKRCPSPKESMRS